MLAVCCQSCKPVLFLHMQCIQTIVLCAFVWRDGPNVLANTSIKGFVLKWNLERFGIYTFTPFLTTLGVCDVRGGDAPNFS